ncbi:MAG TPA: sugar phosphate nucleotidyltransferase, partial [Saprospiraceae bacterium]|nr:sugar phosphate nucleotidyltransferase [Saprospiraceae bacterium]
MLFAAGLGTRLRPLTNDKPKALVEVGGMPLLEIAIRRLMYFGCRDIMVNIHHFGQQILDFLEANENFGVNITVSDERNQLLDTGGGLKKAAWFFQDAPFLVHNTAIL